MMPVFRPLFLLLFPLLASYLLQAQEPQLFPVEVNRFFGYIDANGQMVIKPQFSEAHPFHDSMARVGINGQFGYINTKGLLVVPPRFGSLSRHFSEGLAPVFVQEGAFAFEGQYGYIDKKGEMVITPAYEDALPFSEGRAAVKVAGKWGAIDREGNWVIAPRLEELSPFSEGRARFLREGRYGFYDSEGVIAIPAAYDLLGEQFHEGFVAALQGERWGFIDLAGQWAMPPTFANPLLSPPRFSEGLAEVVDPRNGKWGFIDTKGQWVIAAQYEWAYGFSEGLAAVLDETGWGFIDASGKLVIPFQERLEEVGAFRQGLCRVSIGYSWNHYLNKRGELVGE